MSSSAQIHFWPDVTDETGPKTKFALTIAQNAIQQHDQALIALNTKIANIVAGNTTNTTTENITQNTVTNVFGLVNNQSGNVAYQLQTTDNGAMVIFSDASAIAVSLNSAIIPPFLCFITNFGAGTATLTPTSGTVNGGATFAIPQNYTSVVAFDGPNWWASVLPVVPHTKTAVTHQWLVSYDAATGLFVSTQPDYSDLTGLPVLPANTPAVAGQYLASYNSTTGAFTLVALPAGISVTITTFGPTTNGTMTFTNGLLTAQTPAT